MNYRLLFTLLCGLFLSGCGKDSAPEFPEYDLEVLFDPKAYDADWNMRNADIYEHLLSQLPAPESGRIYYVTTTPFAQWEHGTTWSLIDPEVLQRFPNAAKYRPASEAHFSEGRVLRNGTEDEAWMQWISVRHWISDTEVEVEEGVWCCPLGGGGSITIYEKIDGEWNVKSHGFSWIS